MSAAILLLLFGASAIAPQDIPKEPVFRVDLLDNGKFVVANPEGGGSQPIPWWITTKGKNQIVVVGDGVFAMQTIENERAEQPIAVFAPLIGSVLVKGHCEGPGRCSLIDGSGRVASVDFELEHDSIFLRPPEGASPRLVLRLEAADPTARKVLWSDLKAWVDLPCPAEKDLRAEILALLKETLAPWLERGLDELGPRKTGLLCKSIDAVNGATLATFPGGFHPLWEQIAKALEVEEVPEWRAAYERFLEDWLALCLDPDTGLPRQWDCEKDEPILDRPAGDLALPLGFLIDVGEKGPERFRERARAAAQKIAATVLEKGVLPDGTIGSSYFPKDGRANPSVLELRRFDLLAQLARMPSVRKDPRFVRASEELRSAFEFDHVWWGTWDRIDPGFDDEFGNYGARAAAIALADPEGKEGKAFRAIALDGWKHYAPLWRDALRLGGNVAADQVRCWNLLGDLVKVEPAVKEEASSLLRLAARVHFKGEQYGDGAWGDVTIFRFGPRTGLEVGDLPGAPQNLLNGLATIYTDELGGRTDEVRAMYTAVLRSSVQKYRRPYGFLLERSERAGANPAAGTFRMLLGLVKMLGRR